VRPKIHFAIQLLAICGLKRTNQRPSIYKPNQPVVFDQLPNELVVKILSYLDLSEMILLRGVSTKWKTIALNRCAHVRALFLTDVRKEDCHMRDNMELLCETPEAFEDFYWNLDKPKTRLSKTKI